jgi:hypothetical protein
MRSNYADNVDYYEMGGSAGYFVQDHTESHNREYHASFREDRIDPGRAHWVVEIVS